MFQPLSSEQLADVVGGCSLGTGGASAASVPMPPRRPEGLGSSDAAASPPAAAGGGGLDALLSGPLGGLLQRLLARSSAGETPMPASNAPTTPEPTSTGGATGGCACGCAK
jgi:hypothetical protein